ncbi:protein translocase subunit SecD [Treponema sp.]|uniref:protein translocase subunit SecD n=1 Tax=Treponema sp. TaxID=166 RepID=UPI0025EE1885|nr:protein translocase subunit SecD [Treponema sp.]MCR5219355.1 protein translocase subunit SecD [Treponema sp.]
MKKITRLVIIVAVLAACFAFLWPSISWYGRTSKEDQAVATLSLEKIKEKSQQLARSGAKAFYAEVKANPDSKLSAEYKWLEEKVKDNFDKADKEAPSKITYNSVLESYSVSSINTAQAYSKLLGDFEENYRIKILADRKHYQNSVKLGLDLSGGISIIVKADLDSVAKAADLTGGLSEEEVKKQAMAQTIENLTKKIDSFGLSSPVVRQQGDDRIYIELPGTAESDTINSIVQGRGMLNFRLTRTDLTKTLNEYLSAHPESYNEDGSLKESVAKDAGIPDDAEILGYYVTDDYGLDERAGYLVINKEIVLDGKHITRAEVGTQETTGEPEVNFILDSEGAKLMGDFTSAHKNDFMCIVSGSKVKSNAKINNAIMNGSVAITGFTRQEAENLKKVLQSAWLDVPLSVESQQVIGAELGEIAIKQGLTAIAIGLVAIMIFMLIWYKGAGFNACVVQVLNLYIMFSVLSALNLTLTLPMIAGIILTIGMAVDANVIIYERIKEELALGKDRAASISTGFANGMWAILDSNITTFIAAVFMSQLGTGSIKGFAYSLAIGVLSTLFTTLVVSRLIFDFGTETMHKKNISISWRIK